jgi:MFS family permease
LIPPLGRRAWWLLVGYTLQKLGSGLVWPFLTVYLRGVREIGLGTVGLVLSVISLAGVIAVPVSGWLSDWLGAGRAVMAMVLTAAAGAVLFAFAHGPAIAFVAGFLMGAGNGGMWNAFASLLAVSVPPAQRMAVFGVTFGFQHLGLGLGSIFSAFSVDVNRPGTFQTIFFGEAALFVTFALLIAFLSSSRIMGPKTGQAQMEQAEAEPAPASGLAGYKAALSDKVLLGISILNTLFAAAAVAFTDVAFPAWATGTAGSTTRVVGLAFTANTAVIVVVQLLVLKCIQKRRRTRSIAVAAAVFATACLVTFLAGTAMGGLATAAGLIAALAAFGLADTMLQPSLYAMVNDLAPDALRGKYNAVFNLSWQVGPVVGPAVVGLLLARSMGSAIFIGLTAFYLLVILLVLQMERIVPAAVNLGRSPDPAGGASQQPGVEAAGGAGS